MIVGIVIGTTIFKAPGFIAGQTTSAGQLLGLWLVGGMLAFIGALCYAELGAAYGGAGGDYCYQTRAFGPLAGFLFGWSQFTVVQTVNIGMFAVVFAESAWKLIFPDHEASLLEVHVTASLVVCLVTAVNLIGLRSGKVTQNFLSAAKLAGITLLILAGIFLSGSSMPLEAAESSGNRPVAMIMIFYAYGGWNDAAYVAAEVRNRQRNVPLALLAGVGLVTVVYLAVNTAYLLALGFRGLQTADDAPVTLLSGWLGPLGGRLMSAIVMISALGAVNGLVLSVSRLHAAVGHDHRMFAWLGRWNNRHRTPIGALILQAAGTVALLMLVGTHTGRSLLDAIFQPMIGQPLPWKSNLSTFDLLFAIGAPVFWMFFLFTGVAFFVLRNRDADLLRPFRVPLFPLTPALFCLMCVFGVWSSVRYAGNFTWLGAAVIACGAVVYVSERLLFPRRTAAETTA